MTGRKIATWVAVGATVLAVAVILLDDPTAPSPGSGIADESPTDRNSYVSRYAGMARGLVDVEGGIIRLAASRDGIVREVLVEEGDHVQAGQVLAIQDDRQARLALDVAEAECAEVRANLELLQVQLTAAERERDRIDPLVARGAATQRALDETIDRTRFLGAEMVAIEARLRTAEARRSVAAYEVEQRTIRAPVDGWIVRRQARPGDGVSTLNVTTLFWFVPDAPRIIRAEVEEQFVAALTPGMTAEIVPESDETMVFDARVLRVGQVYGPKRPVAYDPMERVDVRVVECVLALEDGAQDLLLGQRVMVRFNKDQP